MPRLSCTFDRFIAILLAYGFVLQRHEGTSHRHYRGVVGGQVRYVTVAAHRLADTIKPGTLGSMIRQSGLPKALFRQ